MPERDLLEKLQQLHDLILRERECAKALAMEELQAVAAAKEELLQSLGPVDAGDPQVRALAKTIRAENRRNAYLFWSALKWVRESVSFFSRQASAPSYGATGSLQNWQSAGRLLSGKV